MKDKNTGTPFMEIFNIFMLSTTSDKFASLMTPKELNDTLVGYLYKACDLRFVECVKDLSKRSDTAFDVKLDEDEKQIIAMAMKLEWLDANHLANERNLETRLLTKDYHLYSPANHIKVLHDLRKDIKNELRREIVAYQYRHMLAGG